jgi:hypothetical protein
MKLVRDQEWYRGGVTALSSVLSISAGMGLWSSPVGTGGAAEPTGDNVAHMGGTTPFLPTRTW